MFVALGSVSVACNEGSVVVVLTAKLSYESQTRSARLVKVHIVIALCEVGF